VLGEYIEKEELCEIQASDGVISRDEDGLFREPIYYNQDSCESGRAREFFFFFFFLNLC